LEHEDVLLTLGEIAVTLAALSGVAGVLGTRSGQTQLSDFEILLLRNVALIGLAVAAFALLPLTYRGSTIGAFQALRACSALAACSWLGGYAATCRRVFTALRSRELSVGTFVLGLGLNATAVLLLAWNVVAPDPGSPRRYVMALMSVLAIAGINFIVTVLRPRSPDA
jgi:hypothetical protein